MVEVMVVEVMMVEVMVEDGDDGGSGDGGSDGVDDVTCIYMLCVASHAGSPTIRYKWNTEVHSNHTCN